MKPIYITMLVVIIGYLLGSINSAVIYSKLRGEDIRNTGSGNAGATNILRTYGKGAAAIVVVGDIAKGILAVLIGRILGGTHLSYFAGLSAVLGHNYPLYFGFRGGKGILTSLAVMLMISPKQAVISMVFAIVVIAVTRYVSLGSILGSILFGILIAIFSTDLWLILVSVAVVLLAVLRHIPNIRRLCNGTERKLGK
ncbi:MAG: glycerol-3-phosphate 1-O-acyltransferase PlsY [Clostridia bacterium]|nr:glycerol-3-phosphate 1-O-acyltransferase PlsY [Clostridia bacterium]